MCPDVNKNTHSAKNKKLYFQHLSRARVQTFTLQSLKYTHNNNNNGGFIFMNSYYG